MLVQQSTKHSFVNISLRYSYSTSGLFGYIITLKNPLTAYRMCTPHAKENSSVCKTSLVTILNQGLFTFYYKIQIGKTYPIER